jgi:hypothetical protein
MSCEMDADDAECHKRKIPTNLFYDYEQVANPQHPDGRVPQIVIDACTDCKIRVQCLDWALSFEELGYFALTRRNARKKLRKQLGIRLRDPDEAPPWSVHDGE